MKENYFNEQFTTELKIEKEVFINKFSEKFDHSDIDFLSEVFKTIRFSKKNKPLIGILKNNSFKLKRNSSMNSFNYATAVATGKLSDSENGVVIETKIKGFDYKFIPLYIVLGIVFIVSLIGLFTSFGFIIGLIFSSVIFLLTRYNMQVDVKKLSLELTKTFESISE